MIERSPPPAKNYGVSLLPDKEVGGGGGDGVGLIGSIQYSCSRMTVNKV
jgi:hypothetical protein